MTTALRTTILFIIIIIYGFDASAQTAIDSIFVKPDSLILISDSVIDQRLPKRSHLEAAVSFQSNDVYLGRKDSAVLPYYIPELSYYHKSGLYATASLNYLKNATDSRVDLVTLEGGYIFTTGKYDGQLSFSKYFYNSQSTSVTAEISASAAYQNSFDLGFIKPTFTGTLNIGRKLDFAGLFGLEHSFYFIDDKLEITPTFAATASTQNYYNDYYKKRRYTIKRKGQVGQTGIANISGTVLNAGTFKLLDYEPTIPISYKIGKCTVNFTPIYSIPVHPANIDIQTTKADGTVTDHTRIEKISNSFYWTVGLDFLF